MNCLDCLDFILKERCLICNKFVNICKICIQSILTILYSDLVLDPKILAWISIITRLEIGKIGIFCKECILRGLYPDYQFNERNVRLWLILKRITNPKSN